MYLLKLSFRLSFRLPETHGVALPQTLEEALNIGLVKNANVTIVFRLHFKCLVYLSDSGLLQSVVSF